jgi:hypothetical protein
MTFAPPDPAGRIAVYKIEHTLRHTGFVQDLSQEDSI